jgi:hypothetical protein
MGKRFADLLLQRLVPSLEFRKMRFNCHVAYLLASELLPTPYTSTTACNYTQFRRRENPAVHRASRGLVGH